MPVLKTVIVGVTHRQGAQTRLNKMKHGTPLKLVREKQNPHDRLAIAVYDPRDDFQLGYIPRAVNRNLAMAMDAGISTAVTIDRYTPNIHVIYPVPKVADPQAVTWDEDFLK